MKRSSLRTKLFGMGISFVLLTFAGFSITYTILAKQDYHREFNHQIQMALRFFADEFAMRTDEYVQSLKEFASQEFTLSLLLRKYQQTPDDFVNTFIKGRLTIANVTYFSQLGSALQEFGHRKTAKRLLVYGVDKRLLFVYLREGTTETVSTYVNIETDRATLVPLGDTSKLNALVINKQLPPEVPIPEGVPTVYPQQIVNTATTAFFHDQAQEVGFHLSVPITIDGTLSGVLVADIPFYTQERIKRYALLSDTMINVFLGKTLFAGTLPKEAVVADDVVLNQTPSCAEMIGKEGSVSLVSVQINNEPYYQARCTLPDESGHAIGVLTASLPRRIEQRAMSRRIGSVAVVGAIVTLLVCGAIFWFTRGILRFLETVIAYIQRVAKGDIPEKLPEMYSGELLEVIVNLNLLIDAMQETTRIAEAVAEGNLTLDVKERSQEDRLMKAINTMIQRLNQFSQEMDELVHAVQNGQLSIRAKTETFSGGWHTIVVGVNNIMDAVVAPITMTATTIDRIVKGDIPDEITENYRGDFNLITSNLNLLIAAMNDITHLAEAMAAGDLTVEVLKRSEDDTLMRALNAMLAKLNSIVRGVKDAAKYVANRSQDMSARVTEMSEGTRQQAAAAEEVSASIEEMAANIRQNTENARVTEKIALESFADAEKGGTAVAQTIKAMKTIAEQVLIIQEIATQTNMLSLNATIEASKALDFGKGFAVVATEVRDLAHRTREAAKEIDLLAHSCEAISEEAGTILQRLVPSSRRTAELIQEISTASSEQYAGVEQINKAVQQLDTVIQQNAATSEEMAAAAEELASQSEQLQSAMAFFTVREKSSMPHDQKTALTESLHDLLAVLALDEQQTTQLIKTIITLKRQEKTPASSSKEDDIKPSIEESTSPQKSGETILLRNMQDEGDADFERF